MTSSFRIPGSAPQPIRTEPEDDQPVAPVKAPAKQSTVAPLATEVRPVAPPAAKRAAATVAPTKPVAQPLTVKLGSDEQAALRTWMKRGDTPRELRGTGLINELGTALLLQPNHEPSSSSDRQQLESGNWAFFTGSELEAIETVRASIVELAGHKEPVRVAALPLLLTDPETKKSVQLPLFRVDGVDGETLGFVDNLGRQYRTIELWREYNKVPAGQLTWPVNGHLTAEADGLPKTVTENSHAVIDTTLEHVADWAEKIGTVAGFVVGGAALVGVGGIAIPIAGAALAIGFGGKAVLGLVDAEKHGETLNPVKSSEARANWLTAAASLAGLGASAGTVAAVREVVTAGKVTGALGRAAPQLVVAGQGLGTVQVADGSVDLARHWSEMSWKDRMYATSQLAFFGGLTAHSAKQAGGLKNLYSVKAVRAQLGIQAPAKVGETDETPDKAPSLLSERATVFGSLQKADYFSEVSLPSSMKPTSVLVSVETMNALRGVVPASMLNGRTAQLHAARFINRHARNDGDFRYAYGERAYKAWLAADAHLQTIPKGQLAEHLTPELIQKVNALAYVDGDDQALARLGHAARAAQGEIVRGGEYRNYESRSLPFKLEPEQVANVRANGADVSAMHVGDVGEYVLVYPDHTTVPPRLAEILATTRAGLADPNSDLIKVGASFAQRLVALHPLEDGNGRTSRLLLDRILAERDVPPPIFKDTSLDTTLSAAAYEAEVRVGVERMILAAERYASTLSPSQYLKSVAPMVDLPVGATNTLTIKGEVFLQHSDGFVYNTAGRPHTMSAEGVLSPLSQLEHFFIARRASQALHPNDLIGTLTETTRKAFAAAAEAQPGQAKVTVASELPAIAADNEFVLNLNKAGNEGLIGLYDLKNTADLTRLLTMPAADGGPRSQTFVISRHSQLDLEMWHVQKALEAGGDAKGARRLLQYREDLFGLAKQKLTDNKGPNATAQNPLGFNKTFQQLAYDESPLSFDSLASAIKARGDDDVRVWRGDVVMSSIVGMHPDYSPMNPDAFQLASMRGANKGTASIVGDLETVSGSSLGTGYLCYTSDLALLTGPDGFAERFSPLSLSVKALPKSVQEGLKKTLTVPPDNQGATRTFSIDSVRDVLGIVAGREVPPPGKLDVSGVAPEVFEQIVRTQMPVEDAAKLVERYTAAHAKPLASIAERFERLLTDAPVLIETSDVPALQGHLAFAMHDSLSKARDVVQLKLNDDQLTVSTARRAFLVSMSKTDALPGIDTLGGRSFEIEQEITGLGKIGPWRILKTFKRSEMDVDLPGAAAPVDEGALAPKFVPAEEAPLALADEAPLSPVDTAPPITP